MIYLVDTNVIAALLRDPSPIAQAVRDRPDGQFYLCEPVHYEVERGLRWRDSKKMLGYYRDEVIPLFDWAWLTLPDWEVASQFWADARSQGKQLSDMDLLIAAIAHRLGATLVTDDKDFDTLSIPRENWIL
jgi:predicted nucleic acid-binding protein